MKLAFVFPGQGSQSVGMMAGFAAHPVVRATFAEASAVLGEDLWALVADRPDGRAQPHGEHAAGDADRRRRRAGAPGWPRAAPRRPSSPATASASTRRWSPPARWRFATRCRWCAFARRRCRTPCRRASARWPRSSALDDAGVAAACAEAAQGEVVEPVNFNAPGQIVIAGHAAAVERAIAAAKARGAKRGVLLPVSAPFHSSLMKPAAERLAARLADVAVRAAGDPGAAQRRRRSRTRPPTRSARRWRGRRRARCAGSRPCGRSRRAASRTSSSAARARC